jgi:hypothetical protein
MFLDSWVSTGPLRGFSLKSKSVNGTPERVPIALQQRPDPSHLISQIRSGWSTGASRTGACFEAAKWYLYAIKTGNGRLFLGWLKGIPPVVISRQRLDHTRTV